MSLAVKIRQHTERQLRFVQSNPRLAEYNSVANNANDKTGTLSSEKPVYGLSQGGTLYFASTQPKKFYEIQSVLEASASALKLKQATNILDWFHSADEVSQTYLGNAYEKAEAILDRIYDDLGYDKVCARMKEQGVNPAATIFCVNDTGSSFDEDYSAEPEFELSLHEKGLGKWPGVELGPLTDAQGGMKGFYSALKAMVSRKQAEGETVNLSGADENMYLFFKLTPSRDDIVIESVYSETSIEHTTSPQPVSKDNGVYNSFYFSRAAGDDISPEDQLKSRQELGRDYVARHSCQAYGLQAILDRENVSKTMTPAFTNKAKTGFSPIQVATQHNVLESIKNWLPEALFRHTDMRRQDRNVDTIKNGAYQELTLNADAVLLGEHHREIIDNYDAHVLDLFDLWCSLHVDKQLSVETFENTPFFVVNRDNPFLTNGDEIDWDDPKVEHDFIDYLGNLDPKADPWQGFIAFTQYLHEKGFVKQEPRFLHTHLDPDDDGLVDKIKADLDEVQSELTFVPNYEDEQWGRDRTDLYEVTVLGSASTRVKSYIDPAFDFGYWMAEQGWHVRTGGGRYGIMGAVSNGSLSYFEQTGNESKSHISAIQMPRTIQFEGAVFKQKDIKDSDEKFLRVADSFDTRMESLFRSNVSVATGPGIGTYQEILRFVRLKEAGFEPLQDKTMILVNNQQPNGEGRIRLMDPFLAMLPDDIIEKHLTIVPDIETAKLVVSAKHNEWKMKQDADFLINSAPAAKVSGVPKPGM